MSCLVVGCVHGGVKGDGGVAFSVIRRVIVQKAAVDSRVGVVGSVQETAATLGPVGVRLCGRCDRHVVKACV